MDIHCNYNDFTRKDVVNYYNKLIKSRISQTFFNATAPFAVQPNQKKRSQSLARHYQLKSRRIIEARKVFGSRLIHYCVNAEQASTIGKAPNSENLKKARKKAIKAAETFKSTQYIKVNTKKSEQICLAASMHCIKGILYSKEDTLEEAFIQASGLYKNGIPEKVAIAHTIPRNLVLSKERNPKHKAKDHMLLVDRFLSKYFKLQLQDYKKCSKTQFSKEFLQKSPPGIYHMNILDDKYKGHCLVVVKNEDGRLFIYDPNFGAAIIPQNEAKSALQRLFQHPYYRGRENLVFSRASSLNQ